MIQKPYRILVLDDEPSVVDVLTEFLEITYSDDLEIIGSSSPFNSLEMIKRGEIDIAIVDIFMPEIKGDDFLREVKALKSGVEVIMTTGDESNELCSSCFFNGATGYIKKPFSRNALAEVVDLSIKKLDHWMNMINETAKVLA